MSSTAPEVQHILRRCATSQAQRLISCTRVREGQSAGRCDVHHACLQSHLGARKHCNSNGQPNNCREQQSNHPPWAYTQGTKNWESRPSATSTTSRCGLINSNGVSRLASSDSSRHYVHRLVTTNEEKGTNSKLSTERWRLYHLHTKPFEKESSTTMIRS